MPGSVDAPELLRIMAAIRPYGKTAKAGGFAPTERHGEV